MPCALHPPPRKRRRSRPITAGWREGFVIQSANADFRLGLGPSDPFLLFPERSLASGLVPNRDVGFQVLGNVAAGRVVYAAGLFNGIPDGTSAASDVDSSDSKDFAARVAS